MQKGNSIESRFPLWHVSNVQLILGDTSVGSFQSWLHALWRLIGELDGRLVNDTMCEQLGEIISSYFSLKISSKASLKDQAFPYRSYLKHSSGYKYVKVVPNGIIFVTF